MAVPLPSSSTLARMQTGPRSPWTLQKEKGPLISGRQFLTTSDFYIEEKLLSSFRATVTLSLCQVQPNLHPKRYIPKKYLRIPGNKVDRQITRVAKQVIEGHCHSIVKSPIHNRHLMWRASYINRPPINSSWFGQGLTWPKSFSCF